MAVVLAVINAAPKLTGEYCNGDDDICPTSDCCGDGTPHDQSRSPIEVCYSKNAYTFTEEIDGNFYVYDFACQSIQKTTILGGLIVIEEPLNENAIHIGLAASFSLLTLALTQS